ncbi:metallophosphoesterase family protein [Pseudoprimorskyibacter insulae]|uniref:3',5'-cyclic adenosine monophosphate phosphodiesterase CpdA n=1 Tax=Pseudoprimorskyibacter insulae TaxID=1695997 RepID=A0A2R8ARG4_9RHOB|nr:metallophosphoesterase family protein [Pseudoprimorskyibacter insulae]SPF78477.1 3',5'-cyclic adenosine monophosphate phosphodiesterase CpdA [Pseudoprimorskyibacter insulae]
MTRIVHISDLHFGRDRPELHEPLLSHINGLKADLVVVSGDLTQRARTRQFRQARRFLDRIEAPLLCVPGNHDIPFFNPLMRLLHPFLPFKRHISPATEQVVQVASGPVVGVNTVDPKAWQRGALRSSSLARLARAFERPDGQGLAIAVMHHPPEQGEGAQKTPMLGAASALMQLRDCGTDIILCGHMHVWRVSPVRTAGGVLLVQAGTGLSSRLRGHPNDLNLLILSGQAVQIERHAAEGKQTEFRCISRSAFYKPAGMWRSRKGI